MDHTKRLWHLLHICMWASLVLARLYPKSPAGLFLLGFPYLAIGAWIFAAKRLGCPRCGLCQLSMPAGACCVRCGLPVGEATPQMVTGSPKDRELRWKAFPRRRRLWSTLCPVFAFALGGALIAALSIRQSEQTAAGFTLLAILLAATGVLTRFSLIRCPDCNIPLWSLRAENFCGACGACLADRTASRSQFADY